MSLDAQLAIEDVRASREPVTNNSPRVLLLFSAVMVLIFAWGPPDNPAPKLAAMLLAATAAGLALFRRVGVHSPARLQRTEGALIIAALLAGLVLTASLLAGAAVKLASPLWLAAIPVYVLLGLLGAEPMARRLPRTPWAFPLFLVVHAAATIVFLRSTQVPIDVQMFLHDGAGALLDGSNPYSMTYPNIYRPPYTELLYGPGVVVDGRITYGFPYLPVALLVALPGELLGDVRYAQLIAMLLTAVVLRRLASDQLGRAAAVLAVAAPAAIPMLDGAWTEPMTVALLACLVLAFDRHRHTLAPVLIGLLFVSKQYIVVAIPAIWIIRDLLTPRRVLIGLGVAGAVTLPFVLVDPAAFWRAIVEFQLVQPFRADSISLLVSSVNTFGWPPPWTYGVLPLLGGGVTAVLLALRAPRTPAAFAAGLGLALLVTILLSKQAFMNYYFVVSGAFLIAAVAWPTGPTAIPKPGASTP